MRKEYTTFANEKSVLLTDAELYRMEKLAGFQIVTCQATIFVSFLFSMDKKK